MEAHFCLNYFFQLCLKVALNCIHFKNWESIWTADRQNKLDLFTEKTDVPLHPPTTNTKIWPILLHYDLEN